MLEYTNPDQEKSSPDAAYNKVKVIGIGGAGANVLDRIALEGMEEADLVIMGMQRRDREQRPLGELALAIAQRTDVPLILISRRPQRTLAGLTSSSFLAPRSEDIR